MKCKSMPASSGRYSSITFLHQHCFLVSVATDYELFCSSIFWVDEEHNKVYRAKEIGIEGFKSPCGSSIVLILTRYSVSP